MPSLRAEMPSGCSVLAGGTRPANLGALVIILSYYGSVHGTGEDH